MSKLYWCALESCNSSMIKISSSSVSNGLLTCLCKAVVHKPIRLLTREIIVEVEKMMEKQCGNVPVQSVWRCLRLA